jgi:Ni/Co efflux regulator RcnB
MKRFLMSSVTAGLALSLIGGPVALAQSEQHGPSGSQMSSHSNDVHPTGPQHMAVQHTTLEHSTVQPETFQHSSVQHGPIAESHNQQHMAPVQHEAMGSSHRWHNGDHYTGQRHYVSNWSYYHLHQPPQGYEWVQDGSQFVLVAVASGIIADVILNAVSQ